MAADTFRSAPDTFELMGMSAADLVAAVADDPARRAIPGIQRVVHRAKTREGEVFKLAHGAKAASGIRAQQ